MAVDPSAETPDTYAPMPRWVIVFAIVAILLIAVFVLLHLTGLAPGGH